MWRWFAARPFLGQHVRPVKGATGYALDSAGKRAGHVDVVAKSNAVEIALTADAFWYEVVVAR